VENEIDILRDVSSRLARAGVDYMVTGSMAMNAYAEPRMTRDIDIVIQASLSDLGKIMNVFEGDYLISKDAFFNAIRANSMVNIVHLKSLIKIDFIFRKKSEYGELEFNRRKRFKIQDFETFLVTVEDLILSKLDWSKDSLSELQSRDIRNLLRTESIDTRYLEQWANKLGLSERLGNLKK